LYTVAILAMGYKFILKYRHSRYQVVRTISVMFFQTGFAFLIPELLERLNSGKPYFDKDLKNMWPLNYDFFFDWHLGNLLKGGGFGLFMLIFGVAMIFLISPILTYFYGKRWYCSWVCGCGGLAETAGDPFRQLSDKSLNAWKIERWLIHSVLVFVTLMTVAVIYSYLAQNDGKLWLSKDAFAWGTAAFFLVTGGLVFAFRKRFEGLKDQTAWLVGGVAVLIGGILLINTFSDAKHILFINSYDLRKVYGFLIGAAFSGVVGVGFYPLMGSRVWCRFGCPDGGHSGVAAKILLPLPHHHQRRAVHFLRQLLHLLRNGH
jgi:polyferredoxin